MSYQSGYQYANVPSNEDPLSSTNSTRNNIDTTGFSNNSPSSSSTQQQQPQQQQGQRQEDQPLNNNNIPPSASSTSSNTTGTGATAPSSTYAPRAYLPTYHDYMQSHGQQQPHSQQNGMNSGGGYSSNQYFGPSAAYFESQRKNRRNKIIIGIIVGFFLLSTLSHHPENKGTGAATSAGVDVVSGGGSSTSSNGEENTGNIGGETSGAEPGNNGNDDDTTSASSGADSTNADTTDTATSDSTSSTVEPSIGGQGPKLTYLLTYPMSGTTFTMEVLGKLTGMAMATNYERFHPYREETTTASSSNGLNHLRPISTDFPDLLNKIPKGQQTGGEYGYPFWTTSYPETTLPTENILTFSHCDGYCLYPCEPSQYLHTPSSFEEACRTVTFYNETKKNYDSYVTPRNNLNDVSLKSSNSNTIGGIIHLIRDPLSNIVSRYHEYLVINEVEWWLQRDNKVNTKQVQESFQQWCNEMDTNSTLNTLERHQHHTYSTTPKTASTHFFSFELEQKMKAVPCHSEFVKYVAWHNHVVEMIWSRGYESMEVYFEDYDEAQGKVEEAQRMADFLGYDVRSTIIPAFAGGKRYREGYYTADEVEALMEFIQFMSFDKTWDLLKRYFEEETDPQE